MSSERAETCHSCGGPLRPGLRFCPNCGESRPKSHQPGRVPTGIGGSPVTLDDLLDGGLEEGKTYVVAGGAGTGKTIFGLQFLLEGLKRGEAGILITNGDSSEGLIQDVKRFGWNLEQYAREGKLLIMSAGRLFADKKWGGGKDIAEGFVAEVQRRTRQANARRLVIDPIECLTVYGDTITTKEFTSQLVPSMEKALHTTNVLMSRLSTNAISLDAYHHEGIRAAGIIILGLRWVEDEVSRYLFVQKMEWTDCHPGFHKFEIERMKGIYLIPRVTVPFQEGIAGEGEGDALANLPPPPFPENSRLLGVCPRCGAKNLPHYRYCQKCGQMLPTHEGNRIDLAQTGSTEIFG